MAGKTEKAGGSCEFCVHYEYAYQPLSIAATDLDQYLGWDDIIPV